MSVMGSRRRRYRTLSAPVRREVMERSEGLCEAHRRLVANGYACGVLGDQAHHVLSRARGGKDTADNLLWVCTSAHDFIHRHPKTAHRLGLLDHSWDVQ